ncbi:MAG: GNAT family N-acetyltransferase [Thermoplasmata archaeon]|nr:MAG: GNAT family N-acetyltransferase [Thermoplasmata archaeon]
MKELKIKKVTSKNELKQVLQIRMNVFVKEQKVPPHVEIDGLDKEAEHFIVYLKNKPIGCARIKTHKNHAKLERIAITKHHRNKGYGKQLTRYLINYCKQKQFSKIYLHSQTHVADFYEKLGFKKTGKPFYEGGIKHIKMYMKT